MYTARCLHTGFHVHVSMCSTRREGQEDSRQEESSLEGMIHIVADTLG
jgi:hypothetical protein